MAQDEREIENLLYTYAERIDAGDLDGVAKLFAHGKILPSPDASREVSFAGKEQVRGMYEAATRLYEDGTPRTKHVTSNAIIEVAEDARTASTRSYFTVFQQTEELPLQPIISGRYHDTFHRIEGRWWFETRSMRIDLVGDLSHHLLYSLD